MKSTIKLGIPHLNYNGLDCVWFFKELAHKHWMLLGEAKNMRENAQRLYASIYAAEVEFAGDQSQVEEDDVIEISHRLYRIANHVFRSVHILSKAGETFATFTLDSIFLKKSADKKLVRAENIERLEVGEPLHDIDVLDQHKQVKRALRGQAFDNLLHLPFSPAEYFNCIKVLYFANYLHLVSLCEFLSFDCVMPPIKRLTIYYFGNMQITDKMYGRSLQHGEHTTTTLVVNDLPVCLAKIAR
ncbi:MAG TPA: hypothetical protein VJ001_09970 [Rhodocyclaceae bacterium]|nr:hypothetical protein [Rhodocyclaceae bacterium]